MWVSPFAYNETLAQDYFPLKNQPEVRLGSGEPGLMYVMENGQEYRWYEREKSDFQGAWYTPLPIEEYDEKKVGYDIAMTNIQNCLNGVLQCSVTGKPFKIIRQELLHLLQNNLPLPTKSPDARHADRMTLRNRRQLYERTCAKTGEKLMSTFAPDQPEIIYGEKAFQDLQ